MYEFELILVLGTKAPASVNTDVNYHKGHHSVGWGKEAGRKQEGRKR